MRQFLAIMISLFILTGCGSDSSEQSAAIPLPNQQDVLTETSEHKAARVWLEAVTKLDGNAILKYTCLEQRDNIQEITAWTTALPVLGNILSRRDVNVQGDVSDVKFETSIKTEAFAEIYVYGELRLAVSAMADAQMVDEHWYMVFENDTWRWCGSLAGTLSLPLPIHMTKTDEVVEAQSSQSTVENNNVGTMITTAEELEKYVVGLWLDEAFANSAQVDNIKIGIAFFPDGRIADLDGEIGVYRALDSKTIEVATKDWTERLIFEIIDSSTAAISVSRSASEYTIAKRVVANTSTGDISQDILGEWEEIGLMFFTKDSLGVQFSFADDLSGAMSGEILIDEFGTNNVPFSYVVEDNKLFGLLGLIVDVYSLGDFLFLSLQTEQIGFTKFLQRVGSKPTINTGETSNLATNPSVVGVWKLSIPGEDLTSVWIFLSNGLAFQNDELGSYGSDNNGNLIISWGPENVTYQIRLVAQKLILIATIESYAEVLRFERIPIPSKQLVGNLQQDILGTWSLTQSGQISTFEFLPSGAFRVMKAYVEDVANSTTFTGSYKWLTDTRIQMEAEGEPATHFDVSLVDDILILQVDGQGIALLWSE